LAAEETKSNAKGKKSGAPTIPKQEILSTLTKARFQNADEEFLESLSEILYPKISRLIVEQFEQRNQTADLDSPSIVQEINYLMVCCKSLGGLSKKYTNLKPLKVHLTKTCVNKVFNQLLEIQLKNQGFGSITVNSNNRQAMIERLPEYLREILNKLVTKMSSKDPEGFIAELLDNIKDIPVVSVKQVDKKTERLITHKIKQDLKSRLDECLNENKFGEIVYFAMKLKIANFFIIDVPFEDWALRILTEIYEVAIGNDETVQCFRFIIDNFKNQDSEMHERIENMLRDIRRQLSG